MVRDEGRAELQQKEVCVMSHAKNLVSGMGVAMNIVTSLVKEVKRRGGTDEDIHRLTKPEGEEIVAEMAKAVVSHGRPTYSVVVDYTKTLAEMVSAGEYDYVSSDITTDHFPIEGKGQREVEVVLFHFNRVVSSEEVISELEKAGYRPARIEELLTLGAERPELQKEFPIISLGSVWQDPNGCRCVPYLNWNDVKRNLNLNWFENYWREDYRFAGLRKS